MSKKDVQNNQPQLFETNAYLATRREMISMFKEKRSLNKPTYIMFGDSMKCLLCKYVTFSQVHIENFYCLQCDLFHEDIEEDL